MTEVTKAVQKSNEIIDKAGLRNLVEYSKDFMIEEDNFILGYLFGISDGNNEVLDELLNIYSKGSIRICNEIIISFNGQSDDSDVDFDFDFDRGYETAINTPEKLEHHLGGKYGNELVEIIKNTFEEANKFIKNKNATADN